MKVKELAADHVLLPRLQSNLLQLFLRCKADHVGIAEVSTSAPGAHVATITSSQKFQARALLKLALASKTSHYTRSLRDENESTQETSYFRLFISGQKGMNKGKYDHQI